MFDVVMISYDELNADENWEKLQEQVPYAIRIHGIKGIANAHIEAARQVSTSHFFCVDGDNVVDDSFGFDHEIIIDFKRSNNMVHVWRCRNPINGLEYGYGGIKLFPTDCVKSIKNYSVDFCTSVAAASGGFEPHAEIASTTYFNTSEYNTWKSGFRECTKLAHALKTKPNPDDSEKVKEDKETKERLKIWTSVCNDGVEYGEYALIGAKMGARMGVTHDNEELKVINDFSWCKEKFNNEIKGKNILELTEEYDARL